MSLSRKLVAAVESHPCGSASSGLISAEDDGSRIAVHLNAVGHVGLAFSMLDGQLVVPVELSTESLRAWGERLSARLTYLMEPLVIHEVDTEAGLTELRSKVPTEREGRKSFYEAHLVRNGTFGLRRLTFDQTDRFPRTVPCQMTIEVLERLVDDLVASLP